MLTTLPMLLVLVPGHAHGCPGYPAHPQDCAQFYRCDAQGSTHLFRCPAGRRFDPGLGLCNHQHLVTSTTSWWRGARKGRDKKIKTQTQKNIKESKCR